MNGWERTFLKFRPRRSTPEIDAIIASCVHVFQSMAKTMVMMFVRAQVGLGEFDTNKSKI
jgi:hypothetical protein